MKKFLKLLFPQMNVFLASAFFLTGISSATEWRAGVTSAVITPSEPMWTAGYAGRTEPATETISDIYVKALAIQDPYGKIAVIITADLIGYPYEFTNEISSVIEKKWEIPRSSILFNASHTHCGPLFGLLDEKSFLYNIPEEYFAKIRPYREWLKLKFIEVIDQSLENLSPANITISASSPVPFAVSRRLPDGEGGVLYRSNPSAYYTGGPRDDTVPVLKVEGMDGSVKAILFGYAAHPITLSVNQFSGDYPGFAQKYIEQEFPGAVALFVQGCAGQLVPNARHQTEYAMGHGRALAVAVKRAVENNQKAISGPIKTAYKDVTLNFTTITKETVKEDLSSGHGRVKENAAYLMEKIERGEQIPQGIKVPIQAISFGPELLLVGFPGEPVTEYSINSKKEFSQVEKFVWVAGYSNLTFGYLPTLNILREGGYEAHETLRWPNIPGPFAEDVEDIIMEGMRDLVNIVTQ